MSLTGQLKSARMAVSLELPSHPLTVLLDRNAMQEVIEQMIRLACRVMPDGGTLKLLARMEGKHAVVNFMDAAPGQGAPRLGRIFGHFLARNDASQSATEDLSANIAMCDWIVGSHRGRIYAAPSPFGELGITLRLPLLGQAPQA